MLVRLAVLAGVLLVASGSPGAVGLVGLGASIVAGLSPALGRLLGPLFYVAWVLAGLGGFTVLLGARALQRGARIPAKLLLALGSGMGLVGLLIHAVAVAAAGGNPVAALLSAALSLHGAGALLASFVRWRA